MTEIYCGPAPTPQSLLWSWNVDVVALALCGIVVTAHILAGPRERRTAMAGAVAVLAVLFLSPLCALTSALFSARALHHVLLTALAAPLLALAFPGLRSALARAGIGWIAALHAVIFWFWHAPPVYAVAVVDPAVYWLMQVSLIGSAAWLWLRVLDPDEGAPAVMLALLGTIVQMGMLGALLTFASLPLYETHAVSPFAFGLTPREDQQLAGLIMWVPASLPYLFAALRLLPRLLGIKPQAGGAPWSG